MADTLQNVLDYVDTLIPNKLTAAFKTTLVNNEVRKIWRPMTSTNLYEFDTVEGQFTYTLSTDIEFDMITDVYFSDSTGTVTSTHILSKYEYAGPDDILMNNQYYNHLGTLGVYPPSTADDYKGRVFYGERPTVFASSDGSVQFDIDQDYIDLVKIGVMEKVAQSQKETDLANDYNDEYKYLYRRMRMESAKKNMKNPRTKWSYAEWR
jgi:hypothetical protein